MNIKVAEAGDEQEIKELISHLQSTLDFNPDRSNLDSIVEDLLRKDEYIILLARDEEGAAGLLSMAVIDSMFHCGKIARIDEVVVSEGARGQGVGSSLLDEAKEHATKCGALEIEVSTEFENYAAQRFYERHGFKDRRLLLEIEFED